MNTYLLKNLAKEIAVTRGLKKSESLELISLLRPKELRLLTEMLILEDEKLTAHITTSDELSRKDNDVIQKILPNKRVVASVDKKIGAGLKLQVYDMIYDLTVKSSIERIAKGLEEEL